MRDIETHEWVILFFAIYGALSFANNVFGIF
jgi:hypothetical protein